jgi:hypothetical protein
MNILVASFTMYVHTNIRTTLLIDRYDHDLDYLLIAWS